MKCYGEWFRGVALSGGVEPILLEFRSIEEAKRWFRLETDTGLAAADEMALFMSPKDKDECNSFGFLRRGPKGGVLAIY